MCTVRTASHTQRGNRSVDAPGRRLRPRSPRCTPAPALPCRKPELPPSWDPSSGTHSGPPRDTEPRAALSFLPVGRGGSPGSGREANGKWFAGLTPHLCPSACLSVCLGPRGGRRRKWAWGNEQCVFGAVGVTEDMKGRLGRAGSLRVHNSGGCSSEGPGRPWAPCTQPWAPSPRKKPGARPGGGEGPSLCPPLPPRDSAISSEAKKTPDSGQGVGGAGRC